MNEPADDRQSLIRVLHEIVQVLQSADAANGRRGRVLELMRSIVPCDQCALVEFPPKQTSRILVWPEASSDERDALMADLQGLRANLVAEPLLARPVRNNADGALALPLVGNGEVIGILFVRLLDGRYAERHLRLLAIVGGQLAAYLSLVYAHEQLQARVGELDEARRAAEWANRAKDEFLAVVSHELKDPVSSMLAWAHVLVSDSSEPIGSARAVAAIERGARALAKLVDAIQGLGCVATAELGLDLRASEPVTDLKTAIERLREPWERRATPTPIEADPVPSGWPIVERRKSEPAPAPQAEARNILKGLCILLVDDDADILDAFQSVLEHYGAEVTAVGSAAAALVAFDHARPDVLLSDLAMPGENGYDLMRQVAARDPSLPAAALTAFGEVADRGRALAAGFRTQLGKPIDASVLVAAVAELAGRGRFVRKVSGL